LTLRSGSSAPVYAVLVGLSAQTATLATATGVHRVKLAALAALWQGDFATYWQPPPAYTPALSDGNAGPATAVLMQHLAQLDGLPLPGAGSAPAVLNADLRARVRAFQRTQGLEPDGQPGPLTFMQLERTIGSTAPRLQTEPR
jgi:general secretion pathway protein A